MARAHRWPEQEMWLPPPATPSIERDEVHVWRAPLRVSAAAVDALCATLAVDERQRADRFRRQRDRDDFIVARGALREILGLYLDVPPDRIRFSYSEYGKPALSGEMNANGLRFNVSHSEGVALYAVVREREVGLDIEYIRVDGPTLEIAERFFSPDEAAAVRLLPPNLRTDAFFNCWTRKEAYIKALGEGLSHPLDRFTVSVGPTASLLKADDPKRRSFWSLASLSPGAGYAAAVAVEGEIGVIRTWQRTSSRRSPRLLSTASRTRCG